MINFSKWLLLLPVNHSTPSSSPNVFSLPLFKYKATHTICYPFFCLSFYLSLSFCRSFLVLTLQIHKWIVLSERTSSHTSHSGSLQSNFSILVNLASIWQASWPGKPGLDKLYNKSVNFSNAHPLQTLFILCTNAGQTQAEIFYIPFYIRFLSSMERFGVIYEIRGTTPYRIRLHCHTPHPLQKKRWK